MSVEPSRKYWGGGGLLLLILLAVLLAAPLLNHRSTNHPLAGTQRTDLCPLLPKPPASLDYPRGAPLDSTTAKLSATCHYAGDKDETMLAVSLSSTRQLSQVGAADTEKVFAIWMKEVPLSHRTTASEVPGEWRHGGAWKAGDRQSLIFEDGGVLVVLESPRLDAEALAAHARLVQQALRQVESD